MNYAKLTLSVAGGVLLAAAVIGLAVEGPALYRQHELRKRLEAFDRAERALECAKPGACLPEKYAHALDLVKKHLASVEQAAGGYCADVGAVAPDADRRAQLVKECTRETVPRMQRDLQ